MTSGISALPVFALLKCVSSQCSWSSVVSRPTERTPGGLYGRLRGRPSRQCPLFTRRLLSSRSTDSPGSAAVRIHLHFTIRFVKSITGKGVHGSVDQVRVAGSSGSKEQQLGVSSTTLRTHSLGIAAAGTSSRHSASAAGRTVETRRCSLDLESVDGLIFFEFLHGL